MHLTGGVTSYFASLYTLPIIAASTVQSWRGGLMVGALSSLMYAALVVAQYRAPELLPLGVLAGTRCRSCGSRVLRSASTSSASWRSRRSAATWPRGCGGPAPSSSARRPQLADLQAFNQHVIDSLTSGLATTDMEGRILTFNRAAEAITGLAAPT